MATPLIQLLTIVLYLAAGALLARRLWRAAEDGAGPALHVPLILAGGAAILHAAVVYRQLWSGGELNLGLTTAASLMALAIVVLYLLLALFKPFENLGIVVLPVAAATVVAAWGWPGHPVGLPPVSGLLLTHLIIAFLAYSLLALAVVQALLLLWQERRLHHRHPGRLLRALPPLQTMEDFLFRLVGAGFLLLTLTLASGTLFAEALFQRPLVINHHILLSLTGWVIFGILLLGHWRYGWRGRHAVHWTLGGFALLLLGYFGTKFVLEVLLGR